MLVTIDIFVFWDQNEERCGGSTRYNTFKEIIANGLSCEKNPSGSFTTWAISHNHLNWYRTHGNMCFQHSGKSEQFLEIAYPEHGFFQFNRHFIGCALISDFVDLAILSIRQVAALATNWIKDLPEGLKLQNLAVATMTCPVLSSLPQGKQLILHWNSSALAKEFSPHMADI